MHLHDGPMPTYKAYLPPLSAAEAVLVAAETEAIDQARLRTNGKGRCVVELSPPTCAGEGTYPGEWLEVLCDDGGLRYLPAPGAWVAFDRAAAVMLVDRSISRLGAVNADA